MYQIYVIPAQTCYIGESLVAAKNVRAANGLIRAFKDSDPYNQFDSFGYGFVDEEDAIEGSMCDRDGIIHHGIRYHPCI